jgi:hypothetical protein
MQCPNCKGEGRTGGWGCPGLKPVVMECEFCQGSGELPADVIYDPECGRKLKEARIKEGKTLRQFCIDRGISAVERSQKERGYFKVET